MVDHSSMKLGRRGLKLDRRRLKLARYLSPALPDPPSDKDWIGGFDAWGMMLNDSLGDCTIAGVGHALQTLTHASGSVFTASDAEILDAYKAWDGYTGDPATDQGGYEPDVLNHWRSDGLAGHKIDAYADPEPGNQWHVRWAITLFGGLYIGVTLPVSAQNQDVWDVVADDGGVWGGHCVWVPKYDYAAGKLWCVTWGAVKEMTWAWFDKYCDEAHAVVSKDFLNATTGKTPDGVDLATLDTDLAAVTG